MYYYVVYSSITLASRIKNYFRYDGDYMGLMHTPAEISPNGCSYSLKINPRKLNDVLKATYEFGYKIKGVFLQSNDNTFSEVKL